MTTRLESPQSRLSEMARAVNIIAGDVPQDLSLIAYSDPSTLKGVLIKTSIEADIVQRDFSGEPLAVAESDYDLRFEKFRLPRTRAIATERLQIATIDHEVARREWPGLKPYSDLAEKTQKTRNRLSRPERWLAIIGCAVLMGTGAHEVADKADIKNDYILTTATSIGIAFGGLMGVGVGADFEGGVAQRRAMRKVKRAQKRQVSAAT